VCLAALIVIPTAAAAAQPANDPAREEALRVFLDCHSCDFDYLRREIPFVNYVRDRKDAELHILVTTQFTGSGGVEYTFRFIGLGRFEHIDDELKYTGADADGRRAPARIYRGPEARPGAVRHFDERGGSAAARVPA